MKHMQNGSVAVALPDPSRHSVDNKLIKSNSDIHLR